MPPAVLKARGRVRANSIILAIATSLAFTGAFGQTETDRFFARVLAKAEQQRETMLLCLDAASIKFAVQTCERSRDSCLSCLRCLSGRRGCLRGGPNEERFQPRRGYRRVIESKTAIAPNPSRKRTQRQNWFQRLPRKFKLRRYLCQRLPAIVAPTATVPSASMVRQKKAPRRMDRHGAPAR
jgi:hypothetical protein